MRHFAIVGSGPAGFYTAEALEKAYGENARIDILDRYPVPYGLIRFGVAPDYLFLAGTWQDSVLFQRILHDRPLAAR